jgi:soluble lytic murein transglycosylase
MTPLLLIALAAAAPPAATFSPADAEPYFRDGLAGEAARSLRLEDLAGAARGFAAHAAARPPRPDAPQASFLAGYAELKLGQWAAAAARFDALVTSYPLLIDYHRFFAARARLGAGDGAAALAGARLVPADSALDGEARLVRAEALRTLGRPADAAAEYRGYLDRFPTSWRGSEARFHLGEALAAAGDSAAAQTEFRRVYLEAPHQDWGRRAAALMGSPSFDATALAQRAMVLFDNMRNEESEAAWNRVLGASGLTDALACVARYHLAQSVWKARDRTRAAPLFDRAAEACARSHDRDLTAKALYQGGRCWASKDNSDVAAQKRAAALFERVWREIPEHSYADDACLREGAAYQAIEDQGRAEALWAGMPDRFPGGDQRGEALWRLAFRAWRRGDPAAAQPFLERELALLPREEGWWQAGRTLYWLGRIAGRRGDARRAHALWERAAVEYPLSYYALLSLERLRAQDPEAARLLVARLAPAEPPAPAWTFRPRPLFATAAFRRGLELLRLGLGAEARRELVLAGIEPPARKGATRPPGTDDELLWMAAVLYDRAGDHAASLSFPRYLLTDYERTYPVGEARPRWRLAYPLGYVDLVDRNTRLVGVPTALQLAIIREETGFDPNVESFANAVGLTQVSPSAAAQFGAGLPHDRAALRDPATNIAIGARELAHLYTSYAGHAALAAAAYNAGEGPVNRWLRDGQRAGIECDEMIEAIPFEETRGYAKRVVASYFAYRWLDPPSPGERVPAFRFSLTATKPRP